jgi:hypothetical protein
MVAADTRVPTVALQGVLVPQSAINPEAFFGRTRRLRLRQDQFAHPGAGGTYRGSIRQVGIIAGIWLTFSGSVTVTLGGGTAATTNRWPYDLVRNLRFSANGQSNLINLSGWNLKARECMARSDHNDRGVSRGIGGASPGTATTQGTLSLANENWGLGQNVTAIVGAPTVYPVELEYFVPVAHDKVDLTGAIFAQTSSTDLALEIDFATQAEITTLTGAATAPVTGTWTVEAEVYTIPQGGDGQIVVPNLDVFHSIIQTRFANPSNGMNELRLAGQGVGRSLQRLWFRTWNGAVPAPLAMNATNYQSAGWRYGGNDTPEVYGSGKTLAYWDEDLFGVDFAQAQGFGLFDWCSEFAFRDAVDEGSATELRLLLEYPSGLSLTSPFVEYVQETLFAGSVGA